MPPRSEATRSLPEQVLGKAQAGREIVQDFVPLAESLEWELGQEYLRERGNKAFISDAAPVPFVVNNDGTLSRHAAEVFFASLEEAAGPLEEDLFVLELGIGVGLFARFFLDHFRDLCRERRRDYYDRLCYIAADRSDRMLTDVLRHGVLDEHPGRWRIRRVDALAPEEVVPGDVMFRRLQGKPLRAVFLNYLLDCLPASVLQLKEAAEPDRDAVQELHVRTCVGRSVRLEDHTDMRPEALRRRAASRDPAERRELLEVYGLFASEYDYRAADPARIPYGDFALRYGRQRGRRLLHSWGALRCLEKLLDLVAEDGMILINDYGPTQATRDEEFEHQRFSLATFVGVNFPQLRAWFAEERGCGWYEPAEGESRGIHTRLLGRKVGSETATRFYECFDEGRAQHLQEPIEQARACVKVGRFELAAGLYDEALRRQPGNWVLLNEVAMFLTFSLRDPRAGIDMAKLALALNPTCSSDLWSTLGDGLYEFGRTEEAAAAYRHALEINGADVRARYNLAWVETRRRDFAAALEWIAQALALDRTGEYRERLLHKQQEVLALAGQRHQQDYLLLLNLVSRYARPDEGKPAELPRPEHTH